MVVTPRRRVSFDADLDVWETLTSKAKGERGEYLNTAVRRLEHPAYRLVIPTTEQEDSIEWILDQAKREIVLVGTNLAGAAEAFESSLREKVLAGIGMTFVTINPAIQEGDALYEVLSRQLGDAHLVEVFRQRVQRSTRFFRELRTIAREAGVKVRVLGCDEVPMYGLVIADPDAECS